MSTNLKIRCPCCDSLFGAEFGVHSSGIKHIIILNKHNQEAAKGGIGGCGDSAIRSEQQHKAEPPRKSLKTIKRIPTKVRFIRKEDGKYTYMNAVKLERR
jgi:hypothetical protein